jgi:hypothetical protein
LRFPGALARLAISLWYLEVVRVDVEVVHEGPDGV